MFDFCDSDLFLVSIALHCYFYCEKFVHVVVAGVSESVEARADSGDVCWELDLHGGRGDGVFVPLSEVEAESGCSMGFPAVAVEAFRACRLRDLL